MPGTDPGESRARFGLRLLVAILCVIALLQGIRPAVYAARQGVQTAHTYNAPNDPERLAHEQTDYLLAEVRRRIPPGTHVTVGQDSIVWYQRLTEVATLNGVVVAGQADLRISVVTDPSAPYGIRLVTRTAADR